MFTARFANVRLENADDVTTLALEEMTDIVDMAELLADLMPLVLSMEACWSCWENVALSAMMVREISTVALSTEAAMRFEQS